MPQTPDIFISYAREDQQRVQILASVLAKQNWLVFWDRNIPFGQNWHSYIEQALRAAKCVIVVWSRNSTTSRWVIDEANEGAKRGILVPILLDPVDPPLGFGTIHTADLSAWRMGNAPPHFEQLVQAIQLILGDTSTLSSGNKSVTPVKPPIEDPGSWNRRAFLSLTFLASTVLLTGTAVTFSPSLRRTLFPNPRFVKKVASKPYTTSLANGFYRNTKSNIVHYVLPTHEFIKVFSIDERRLENWAIESFNKFEFHKDGARVQLASASFSFENAIGSLTKEEKHIQALELLRAAITHDLQLQKRSGTKPSLRLYDLFAGLSVRYNQPQNLKVLTDLVSTIEHRQLLSSRVIKWNDNNCPWYKGWLDRANKKQWAGLLM